MNLQPKQIEIKEKIESVCNLIGVDPDWALAIASVESSLGLHQKSPTGCLGVFQMSSIAMKDLRQEMENATGDMIDIFAGISFLALLLKRHKDIETATAKFCDPDDRSFYIDRVMNLMNEFKLRRLDI